MTKLTKVFGNETRKPSKPKDEQIKLGRANNTVQEHWMLQQLEERVAAARTINKEQTEATVELIHAYEILGKIHDNLVHQLQKLIKSTEELEWTLIQAQKHN